MSVLNLRTGLRFLRIPALLLLAGALGACTVYDSGYRHYRPYYSYDVYYPYNVYVPVYDYHHPRRIKPKPRPVVRPRPHKVHPHPRPAARPGTHTAKPRPVVRPRSRAGEARRPELHPRAPSGARGHRQPGRSRP